MTCGLDPTWDQLNAHTTEPFSKQTHVYARALRQQRDKHEFRCAYEYVTERVTHC